MFECNRGSMRLNVWMEASLTWPSSLLHLACSYTFFFRPTIFLDEVLPVSPLITVASRSYILFFMELRPQLWSSSSRSCFTIPRFIVSSFQVPKTISFFLRRFFLAFLFAWRQFHSCYSENENKYQFFGRKKNDGMAPLIPVISSRKTSRGGMNWVLWSLK